MTLNLKGLYSEHGAWAVPLASLAGGYAAAWPPSPAAWALLPALFLFVGTKGLVQRVRRTGRGYAALGLFLLAACACSVPFLVKAPAIAACLALPALLYGGITWRVAASPQAARSLSMELSGAILGAAAGPAALLASRPEQLRSALWLWACLAVLFAPGIFRARLRKDPSAALRWTTAGTAFLGLALWLGTAFMRRTAPWSLIGATVFLGDAWAAWALPAWSVRHLGLFFAIRYTAAALLLGLAWRPFP